MSAGTETGTGTAADVVAICSRYRPAVEQELLTVLDDLVADPWMNGAIGYHFGWADEQFERLPADTRRKGGKQLRGTLSLLAYSAAAHDRGLTVDVDPALPFAAAIELLHNFTLIHDDLQDGDRVRWGRPTLWAVCGAGEAMNVGDCLHALAVACLGRLAQRGLARAVAGYLAGRFARTAVELAVGQHYDLAFESENQVTVDRYLAMIDGKTAAMMRGSAYGGALLAGAGDRAAAYGDFGTALGLAFQIRDDILGIWGAEEATGKASGRDLQRRKKSLPVVFALERAAPEVATRVRALYSSGRELTAPEVEDLRSLLDSIDARGFAQQEADRNRDRAVAGLAATGNPFADDLKQLAAFAASRTF